MAQAPQSNFIDVNGVRLHYLMAGKGDPVVLLHGFAETSHMWLPLIAELADRHTVIAPDLCAVSGNPPRLMTATPRKPWRRTSMRWCKASATTVFAWSATILG
jgi:pimeloyl-ACP methyl ester carboxylesterase